MAPHDVFLSGRRTVEKDGVTGDTLARTSPTVHRSNPRKATLATDVMVLCVCVRGHLKVKVGGLLCHPFSCADPVGGFGSSQAGEQ